MRDFAEKTKCLSQPRKMLIGSYFAKKIFLIRGKRDMGQRGTAEFLEF